MSPDLEAIVTTFLAELDPSLPRGQELVREVASHVDDAMRRHMVLGRGPEEALVAALRDVGELAPVARAASHRRVADAVGRAMAAWSERGLLESLIRRLRPGAGR